LTIIDVRTNAVLHRVNLEIGANPSDIAIHPNGRTLYIANTALNSVSVIDALSFHTIEVIPVGQQPLGLAVDTNGTKVLVANSGANTVSVIDTGSNRVLTTIPVEFQPISVAIEPTGARAFVSHLRSPRMSTISLSSLRIETRVNTGPAAAVLSDGTNRRVFVGLLNQNRVGLFDATIDAELATAPVGQEPNRIALDVDRGKIYVVNRGSDNVSVLDRNTLRPRTEIPAGKRPYGIATIR
jgi:YVTN family beta-propeller protein